MNASSAERGAIERFFGGATTAQPTTSSAVDDHHQDHQDEDPKQESSVAARRFPKYFITLAPISSDEADVDEDHDQDCSSSVYDSIHNRETDICYDTDDYSTDSSYSSEGGVGQAEVIEFDVVTASSDDGEFLYLEDSSSGSDAYIDQKILVLRESGRQGSSGRGGAEKMSTTDDDEDDGSSSSGNGSGDSSSSDEAEDPEDPELRPADYWKCVKCNNAQNNPLYRYCEKCYQLRKNYFPPRPKISKTRPPRKGPHRHHHHGQSSTEVSSSDDEEAAQERQQPRTRTTRKSPQQKTGNHPNPPPQTAVFVVGEEEVQGGHSGGVTGANNGASQASLGKGSGTGGGQTPTSSLRKRALSSQTTEEDDEDDELVAPAAKKAKGTSSDEGVCSSSSSSQAVVAPPPLRPTNLLLANVLGQCESSGCSSSSSSYSSGHESLPSPVEGGAKSVGTPTASEPMSQADSAPLVETVSLSRDHQLHSGWYSDSETYRRTSTKCVVNVGEANAIIRRRLQGELGGSRSVGVEAMATGTATNVANRPGNGGAGMPTTAAVSGRWEKTEEEQRLDKLCIICVSEPKDSAFVHTRSLHICCCYRCAIKVWNKKKRCPICNCKVKNVLKCYVH